MITPPTISAYLLSGTVKPARGSGKVEVRNVLWPFVNTPGKKWDSRSTTDALKTGGETLLASTTTGTVAVAATTVINPWLAIPGAAIGVGALVASAFLSAKNNTVAPVVAYAFPPRRFAYRFQKTAQAPTPIGLLEGIVDLEVGDVSKLEAQWDITATDQIYGVCSTGEPTVIDVVSSPPVGKPPA